MADSRQEFGPIQHGNDNARSQDSLFAWLSRSLFAERCMQFVVSPKVMRLRKTQSVGFHVPAARNNSASSA